MEELSVTSLVLISFFSQQSGYTLSAHPYSVPSPSRNGRMGRIYSTVHISRGLMTLLLLWLHMSINHRSQMPSMKTRLPECLGSRHDESHCSGIRARIHLGLLPARRTGWVPPSPGTRFLSLKRSLLTTQVFFSGILDVSFPLGMNHHSHSLQNCSFPVISSCQL